MSVSTSTSAPTCTAAPLSLPVIDLDRDLAASSEDTISLLRDACLRHGFFCVRSRAHVPPSLVQNMWDVAARVFDEPRETKERNAVTRPNTTTTTSESCLYGGYFSSGGGDEGAYREINKDPHGERLRDNKEGYFFGSPVVAGDRNVYPRASRAVIEEYMHRAHQLARALARAVMCTGLVPESAPKSDDVSRLSCAFDVHDAEAVYMLKILRYPPSSGNTDAHTDYGFLTLLLPGDKGLEVYYEGAWRPVQYVPDAFVVNFGDLAQTWSGGAIKSTLHRVVHRAPHPRYAIPFFLHPRRGTVVSGTDTYAYLLSRFQQTYPRRTTA